MNSYHKQCRKRDNQKKDNLCVLASGAGCWSLLSVLIHLPYGEDVFSHNATDHLALVHSVRSRILLIPSSHHHNSCNRQSAPRHCGVFVISAVMSMIARPQMYTREIYWTASTTVSKVVQDPRRLVVDAASELKVRVRDYRSS